MTHRNMRQKFTGSAIYAKYFLKDMMLCPDGYSIFCCMAYPEGYLCGQFLSCHMAAGKYPVTGIVSN